MGWAVGILAVLGACRSGSEGATSEGARVSSSPTDSAERSEGAQAPTLAAGVDVAPGGRAYPGQGFRVHEWGTNTLVLGSDGSVQRGLHHEEEDLPSFVYDRTRGEAARSYAQNKMETPVTFFYSDVARDVSVRLSYPEGVLTQWYPRVTDYAPWVDVDRGDPVFDKAFPFTSSACREQYALPKEGSLTWGSVHVRGRDETAVLPPAPLERFTWSHARNVASNALVIGGEGTSEEEKFLFYRGLGNHAFPARISAIPGASGEDGGVRLENLDPRGAAIGAVFVLRVENDKAAFHVFPAGLAAGASLDDVAPPATRPLAEYAQALADAVVQELDAVGLYHDESASMVKTWARQWFRTPGVRVLYVAPQVWTDAQIPLAIEPKPEEMLRVMVIRNEVLTRKQEAEDLVAVRAFASDGAPRVEAIRHFDALGRFAEPRLRRAMTVFAETPDPTLLVYLESIAQLNATQGTGE